MNAQPHAIAHALPHGYFETSVSTNRHAKRSKGKRREVKTREVKRISGDRGRLIMNVAVGNVRETRNGNDAR